MNDGLDKLKLDKQELKCNPNFRSTYATNGKSER